jgi:hypothetical protein
MANQVPSFKPCDLDCQKERDLKNLRVALDEATANKDKDPVAYEKARVAYYTLLNGPGWLVKEKDTIAKEEISQKITDYTTQYNALKKEQGSQGVFASMMSVLKSQEDDRLEDNRFLRNKIDTLKDKYTALNRLDELGAPKDYSSWLVIGVDVVIVILGLILIITLYSKMNSIKALVGFTNNETVSAMSGGRRS